MHFLNPTVLWLVAIVPPLGGLLVYLAYKRKDQFIKEFGEPRLVMRNSASIPPQRYLLKGISVFVALAALIVAVARPAIENGYTELPRGTVDVIAVVDVSRSMAVQDYKGAIPGPDYAGGTRLDMARYLILNDVIGSLRYNRLGVVSYAGDPLPQAFISDDLPALRWILKRALTISSAPGEGSELGKAFKLAFELFDLDSDDNHRKIIVLFSDGGNDSGMETLAEVISECKKRNIEVIIAGLGKPTPSAIPISQLSQQDRIQYRDKQWYEVDGEVQMSALEENTLLWLKNALGARYVRVVQPSDFAIGNLVSRVEVTRHKGREEVFIYPLMLAAAFLTLALVAPRERKDPKDDGNSGVRSTLGVNTYPKKRRPRPSNRRY